MTFGERIKMLREEKHKSQQDIANIVGRTQQSVDVWERNLAKPQADIIKKLADYFNVSTDYLLNREKRRAASEETNLEEVLDMLEGLSYCGKPLSLNSINLMKNLVKSIYDAETRKAK
ncbi:helix-turn-helix domain-containing protein [Selenomonadales bacterium OttesenSCG-928-I06]|nr:helix-turn-helix domain-containing protein [Selenomonadales bacterium OttesenSCG-928-I06]